MAELRPEAAIKRVSILQKLVASHAAISLFGLVALVVSYAGLYSLNRTAREIVTRDFFVINSVNKLRESVIAQQSYAAKFTILKGGEFQALYRQRETEARELLARIERVAPDAGLGEVSRSYRHFTGVAASLFDGTGRIESLKGAAASVEAALDKALGTRQALLDRKLESARERERWTVRLTLLISLTGFLLGISVAAAVIINVARAVRTLKRATHRVAEGDFDFDPGIPAGDEIGALAEDFMRMTTRLKELEQMSLDASPLTRLPGNIAIERVLERKLAEGSPFAVCYGDLDNFKAYNDRYGYIRGSELIKATGEVIDAATRDAGDDPFVGHVGGDDFVMVVAPEQVATVCGDVIERFDRMIPDFYSPDDRARGWLEGPDRYGVVRRFPLMTISISVVICHKGTYDSAVTIARTAAEMKDNIKAKAGSNYFINRRALPR